MPDQIDEISSPDEGRAGSTRMDGFFLPWVTDATALHADVQKNGREKLRHLVLVQPVGVRDYENPGVLFVAGDRGTGKSSVLLKKAVALLDRDAKTYRTLRPYAPFVNELAQSAIAVPLQQYRRLSGPLLWEAYWRLVLTAHYAAMALRHRNVPHAGDAKKILVDYFNLKVPADTEFSDALTAYNFFHFVWINSAGQRESLAPTMNKLVNAGPSEEDVKRWTEKAENVLSESLGLDPVTQFSIFVDAIDEAVGSPQGRPLFRYLYPRAPDANAQPAANGDRSLLDEPLKEGATHDQFQSMASWMWRYAQTGFMLAAAKLWGEFSQRLWTYGAVRREAQEWFTDPASTSKTRQKLEGNMIVGLSYSKEQLADIFALNVRFTPSGELFSPVDPTSAASEAYNLFGFDHVSHPRVLGEDEPLLELMIRHTFMAPRQLVGIARSAKQLQIVPRMRPQNISSILDAINNEARVVFEDFVANVSPAWTNELRELTLQLRSNVLTAAEVEVFEAEHRYPGFFAQLYSRGLVGIPKHNSSEAATIQVFRRPNGAEVELDNPPYVFLHPALASYISLELKDPGLQRHFYSSDFIVGEGLKCPYRLVEPRIVITYLEGNDHWDVRVGGKIIGPDVGRDNASGTGAEAPDKEIPEEHAKAAMMIIVLVACAMRRTQKHRVALADLEKQAKDFELAGIYGGRLCDYPLSDFPRLYLLRESGYIRTAREWLKAAGLNLGSTDHAIHSIRFETLGSEVDPLEIRALPVHKRRGTSKHNSL